MKGHTYFDRSNPLQHGILPSLTFLDCPYPQELYSPSVNARYVEANDERTIFLRVRAYPTHTGQNFKCRLATDEPRALGVSCVEYPVIVLLLCSRLRPIHLRCLARLLVVLLHQLLQGASAAEL